MNGATDEVGRSFAFRARQGDMVEAWNPRQQAAPVRADPTPAQRRLAQRREGREQLAGSQPQGEGLPAALGVAAGEAREDALQLLWPDEPNKPQPRLHSAILQVWGKAAAELRVHSFLT